MVRKNNTLIYFFGVSLLMVTVGCGDKSEVSVPSPVPAQSSSAPSGQTVEDEDEFQERPVYVYTGDRFKDPFAEIGQSTAYQPDAIFSPQQAKLTALVYGRSLKSAVVNVAGSGSYFIRKGRIFDVMGKSVKGYKAKVFLTKVVITGEADDIFELNIRETEGDES